MLVALVACIEALAFIGMLVPGAALMIGAGMLIGVGALGFWSTFAWAVAGAVLGDGISYWIGHRYRDSLQNLPWLRSRPEILNRGQAFLDRHGGKSIFLARFVGPMRPIVPVVAGTLGMPPWRFYLNNILSALVWAPAHLVPGMVFGASLALAREVAGRLALGFALFVSFVWFVAWAVRHAYRWLTPKAQAWATRILVLGKRHPALSWLIGDLVDPDQPVAQPLLIWFTLLIGGVWLFFGVVEDIEHRDPLVYAGLSVYRFLQQLRTPIGDQVMIASTELGDAAVVVPIILIVLGWLLWQRAWRDAKYWLAAVLFGVLSVQILKYVFHMPRPIHLYSGIEANGFPSSHAAMGTVVYGFLAVLSARSFSPRWRWIPYAFAAFLVCSIAFSRLYLGAHWLADVAAGLSLGVAWITLLAIGRARHDILQRKIAGLPAVALVGLIAFGTWHIQATSGPDLERYAVRHTVSEMPSVRWREDGWRTLPASRIDLRGDTEQPLNVQYAGDLSLLTASLAAHGWSEPKRLTPRSALSLLLSNPVMADLPVFPQLDGGQFEKLVLVKRAGGTEGAKWQYLLRIWQSDVRLDGRPLWIGSAAKQDISRLPLIRYPHLAGGYDEALLAVQSSSSGLWSEIGTRTGNARSKNGGRHAIGRALLIQAPKAESPAD